MQLLVPDLELVFVPILKNASRVLTQAIQERYPSCHTVGDHIPGDRVVMWRNPYERLESAYQMRADNGIEEKFCEWVVDSCKQIIAGNVRDPHLRPQIDFCDNPMYLLRWDFDGFKRLFRLKKIEHENESGTIYDMEWTSEARSAFRQAYRHDIRIWERNYGQNDEGRLGRTA